MPSHSDHHGFTLVEVMVTTTIAILLLTVGVPAMNSFISRTEARQDIGRLNQMISFTRTQALLRGSRTTLCPLNASLQCSNLWNDTLSVFTDTNNNRALDTGEQLLFTLPANQNRNVLRSFNSRIISFDERGFAGVNTGSLSYCHIGGIPTGVAFIISRNGRVRPGTDKNNDGLQETPNGNNVPCPPA
ncbi:MAG: GspH/FimT family pseudopilin [Saccharospirillaceae bacterium]|nr:GspH/FimT family pseudopilin [Saccharospirillaceae bacterium]MCD8532279.1 GspH/FimT family pseudopilin [Saccharospirillaceae bacterium]